MAALASKSIPVMAGADGREAREFGREARELAAREKEGGRNRFDFKQWVARVIRTEIQN